MHVYYGMAYKTRLANILHGLDVLYRRGPSPPPLPYYSEKFKGENFKDGYIGREHFAEVCGILNQWLWCTKNFMDKTFTGGSQIIKFKTFPSVYSAAVRYIPITSSYYCLTNPLHKSRSFYITFTKAHEENFRFRICRYGRACAPCVEATKMMKALPVTSHR